MGNQRLRVRGTTAERIRFAQKMRQAMTPAEVRLWAALRHKQLAGLRFRAQHPVGPFILDFYCPSQKLAIELDGPDHIAKQDEDRARDEHLMAYGYRVLRFTDGEVLSDLDGVLSRIRAASAP